jgi:uncharacterized membrane protein (UPF0136 family)
MSKIVEYAIVFFIMFLIGGTIGYFSFPEIPGIFYIAGLIFGAFATGAGSIIINLVINR